MSFRISTLRQFNEVFAKGRYIRCGSLITIRWVFRDTSSIRWGVAVSSKQWKRAVDRNRIKRVLREAVQPLLPYLNTSMDIVLLFSGQSISITPDEVRKEIQLGLIREGILRL